MREIKESYEPLKVEEEIRKFWLENKILDKVYNLRKGHPFFRFLEGPPTANGFMHIGHARGRTMKDIVLRFKSMCGFNVWRKAGWDCQGLPVEIEVEKKLKLKSKRDIESVGLDVFVEECKTLVEYYINHWRGTSERLAIWLDYDHAYKTMDDEYIEFVWWFIKKSYEKGLLKEDLKVVPTCPRCETSLSSHEVSLGYTVVSDPSIYVKFQLKEKQDEYILVWTTTPWTLPGNEAVTVHPDADYAKVLVGSEKWILAKNLVEKVMRELKIENFKVVETIKGVGLKGLKYIHPLLDEVPEHKTHSGLFDHTILCGLHVSLEEGTGCVHTAPAHGPEDFEVGLEYGIQIFCPVDQSGYFTDSGGKYAGFYFKDADNKIIEDLRVKGLLVYEGKIEHEYPLCWRCETPLLYRVDKQWFLKVSNLKQKLLEENKKVLWIPRWAGENRFGEWLANAEDWCISRARIWGSPLNVWRCKNCGALTIPGTINELKSLAKKLPSRLELHRPWIDEVTLLCSRCGGDMFREPFVVDCWLDSGVAHSASINALKDEELLKKLYPYDFITEAVDQTRGWFYSLLSTAIILYGKTPYLKVLCQGHVVDKYGQKMSKSRGNVVWVENVLHVYGADVLRAYLIWKASPEATLAFDHEELNQIKRMLSIIWNIFAFATTYMLLDNFKPSEWPMEKVVKDFKAEDKWLFSRFQNVIKNVTVYLETLELNKALRELLDFLIDDVSRFYIRVIRRRTWVESKEIDKFAAYVTLYNVLMDSLKLLSPFTPYIAEALYRFLAEDGLESIHMYDWPKFNEAFLDEKLEEDFKICREVIKATSTARQRKKFKLRWPVNEVIISPVNSDVMESLLRHTEILLNQVNAKKVTILMAGERPKFLRFEIKPKPSLGAKFKELTPTILRRVNEISRDELIRTVLEKGFLEIKIDNKNIILTREDFEILEVLPDHISKENFTYGSVFVDVTRTPEIIAEAFARDVVRRAQLMRKEMGLNVEDYVNALIGCESAESIELLKSMENYIKAELRVKQLDIVKIEDVRQEENAYIKDWDVEDEKVKILLEKA
ncbi:MAG: isoleucine--tRNA ligase [Candidatus Bathyarchaeota archaeon]